MDTTRLIKIAIALAASLFFWFAPPAIYGLPTLSIVEQRMISIFAFAAIMWITEAIPIWTTSVAVIVIMLLTVSNNSFVFLREGIDPQELGSLVSHKNIMATFADPIVMLFLGGFVLAIVATRCGLDAKLAKAFMKPFGTRSEIVLLGFMVITAVFSMFMSNTATAAMMLAIIAPVLRTLPSDGKGKIGLTLAVPIGANIGGIGTPIGTPPNAIALKYLNDPDGLNMQLGFGEWMMYMVPFVIVLIFIAWVVLLWLFPFKQKNIHIEIPEVKVDKKTFNIVAATFIVTVLLWVLDKATGLNANIVALVPVGVFCVTGIFTKDQLKEINWDVLWLVAGGFALGVGMNETGLAKSFIENIPFDTWPPILMMVGAGVLCYVMSTFMSNTATAALLIPILSVVAKSAESSLAPYGGEATMLIGIAVAASLAMALPISTPPNALAHAQGTVSQDNMVKIGVIVGVIGIILSYCIFMYLGSLGFFA
jgi:sodium-dependent dicarboxylate transporter 2/3/5